LFLEITQIHNQDTVCIRPVFDFPSALIDSSPTFVSVHGSHQKSTHGQCVCSAILPPICRSSTLYKSQQSLHTASTFVAHFFLPIFRISTLYKSQQVYTRPAQSGSSLASQSAVARSITLQRSLQLGPHITRTTYLLRSSTGNWHVTC
jgi:hypothetical protein